MCFLFAEAKADIQRAGWLISNADYNTLILLIIRDKREIKIAEFQQTFIEQK